MRPVESSPAGSSKLIGRLNRRDRSGPSEKVADSSFSLFFFFFFFFLPNNNNNNNSGNSNGNRRKRRRRRVRSVAVSPFRRSRSFRFDTTIDLILQHVGSTIRPTVHGESRRTLRVEQKFPFEATSVVMILFVFSLSLSLSALK